MNVARGISSPEWEDLEFKMPVPSSECSQRYSLFVETDLVVSTSEVNLCEVLWSGHLVKDVVYARERVSPFSAR